MQISQPHRFQVSQLFPETSNASQVAVYVSGTGSITLEHRDDAGDNIPLTDGALDNPSQNTINNGFGARLYANVTGCTPTTPLNIMFLKIT